MSLLNLFCKRSPSSVNITAETSAPQTDTEHWLTAACAIWSEYCGGSWNYIGGFEKTPSNTATLKSILNSDWLVTDHDSGIRLVEYLLRHAGDEREKYAFNYACAINICGRMYLCDFLTRKEYVQYSREAGQRLQERYHSWEEYCSGYIKGTTLESGVADKTHEFTDCLQKLSSLRKGPYQVDWNLRL